MGFVRLSSSGRLVEGDESTPFTISGANCYYLMTKHHEKCRESKPMEVLESLKHMGINCIRTWAFSDGDTPSSLQPYPFFHDESVFQSLDKIISRCQDLDMKIILDLTNFWPDYGGMGQYVRWSREKQAQKFADESPEVLASHFYEDPFCQNVFRRFMKSLVSRKNTCTGTLYGNDPTILGYGLANEPRCYLDPGCTKHTIATWAHVTARYLKHLDKNHLILMDCEGFFGPSTAEMYGDVNPFETFDYGTDFAQDTNSPFIDICCIHMYPEKWMPNNSEIENIEFIEKWIHSHLQVATVLEKPLLITEYGFLDKPGRERYFIDFASIIVRHISNQSNLVGSIFWQACSEAYQYGDEYAVRVDSNHPDDDNTKLVIEEMSTALKQGYRNLNRFQSQRIKLNDERYVSTGQNAKKLSLLKSSPASFRRKIDSEMCSLM